MRRALTSILMLATILGVGLAPAGKAAAQSGGVQIQITQVDNSHFPQVTVYVSVTDAAGQPVGVDPASIQLMEGGQVMVPTSIVGGGQGGAGPLTTMLVMDVSGSMDKNGKIDGAKAAARTYVDQMRPGDQAGLMVYNTQSSLEQPITEDHSVLSNAIDGIQTGGDTAMYDAIVAAEAILRDLQGRKAILVVTDGLDNHSSNSEDDVINAIGPSGLSVSTIGLGDSSSRAQTGLDEAGLKSLAQRAGGGYGYAGDPQALSVLFQMYGRALQNEYAVTYTSPFTLRDGVNRDLTVSLEGSSASVASKYNPGGVLPEVSAQNWPLFAAILVGLAALLVIPMLVGGGAKLSGGGRKRGRIKLSGAPSAQASSSARGRIKIK